MELIAVDQALQQMTSLSGHTHLCLCSDSLSLLKHLNHPPPRITATVHKVLQTLRSLPVAVILLWSPGHCEIGGNELADELCQAAPTRGDTALVTWKSVRHRVLQMAWQHQRESPTIATRVSGYLAAPTTHRPQHDQYFEAQSIVLPRLQVDEKWSIQFARQVMQLRHHVHAAFVQPALNRVRSGASTWGEGRMHCFAHTAAPPPHPPACMHPILGSTSQSAFTIRA
eukprot:3529334-Amphidinium_carterae.1